MCLAQGHNTVTPVRLESAVSSQALHHCALIHFIVTNNMSLVGCYIMIGDITRWAATRGPLKRVPNGNVGYYNGNKTFS